jgi:hypothetical protein
MMEGDAEAFETILHKLAAMRIEHRDLDQAIARLSETPLHDELQLKRLKRRKLLLKDQLSWLERQLDPDTPA